MNYIDKKYLAEFLLKTSQDDKKQGIKILSITLTFPLSLFLGWGMELPQYNVLPHTPINSICRWKN